MAIIYRHLKPNGEVFYIGIGRNKDRAYVKKNRTEYWNSVVNKHGYEVQILKSDLSWDDAKELETILIDYYGRRDLGKGTLVNMTDGGDGANVSEKTKEKLRNINLGKTQSKETVDMRVKTINAIIEKRVVCICTKTLKTWGSIAKCADDLIINYDSLRGQISPSSPILNYTSIMMYSDFIGDKIKTPHKGVRPKGKKQCINTLTGEIFKSVKEAAESSTHNRQALYRMLSDKANNRSYFLFLSDYKGNIHYPEKKVYPRDIKIKIKKTEEVFQSKKDLAIHLGMTRTTADRYIDKHKEDFIILTNKNCQHPNNKNIQQPQEVLDFCKNQIII